MELQKRESWVCLVDRFLVVYSLYERGYFADGIKKGNRMGRFGYLLVGRNETYIHSQQTSLFFVKKDFEH